MSPKLPNYIKNLIELREIKNFKTQKFKPGVKDQVSYLAAHELHLHHRHQPLYHNYCTANFNCWRIYQVSPLPLSSSTAPLPAPSSLVQIASALQLSIITTSCVKMSLTIVLLLSIVASHIANCQAMLERDNNFIIFSQSNNLSEKFLHYVRVKQNVVNKSLILGSKSTINDKVIEYKEKSTLRDSYKPLDTMTGVLGSLSRENDSRYQMEGGRTLDSFFAGRINKQNQSDDGDDEYLLKIVMEGLGLQRLPDFQKANISQLEYATKYNEYLDRIRERNLREFQDLDSLIDDYEDANTSLTLMSIPHNPSEAKLYRQRRSPNKDRTSPNRTILLRFPLNIDSELEASDIEEANIRLLLITSPALATSGGSKRRHRLRPKLHSMELDQKPNSTEKQKPRKASSEKPQKHILNMKVYQLLEPKGRVWIDGRKIEIKIDRRKMDETTSQWLQFDVTKAVEGWLINKQRNLGLEIQCDNCFRNGARIIDDLSGDSEEDANSPDEYDLTPVLNIIGRLGTHREKRSKHHHNQMTEKPKRRFRKSNCYKDNQRCCRHTMEVVFKEIKGFEFIIQPKVFDAGYCRGRCPPRYNPAHHHALLQSLIWKQDRTKVPRPCCAPSKLIELEVLHVDEKDNEKLKISTWTDMRVVECACS